MAKGTEPSQLAPSKPSCGRDGLSCTMKEVGGRWQVGGRAAPSSTPAA